MIFYLVGHILYQSCVFGGALCGPQSHGSHVSEPLFLAVWNLVAGSPRLFDTTLAPPDVSCRYPTHVADRVFLVRLNNQYIFFILRIVCL